MKNTKIRTLRVNILTLFLSLIVSAFFIIFSFTYIRDYDSIMAFSKGVAKRSISIVLAKFQAIALSSERVTRVSAGFFPFLGPLSVQNPALISYMLNMVKYDSNFSNFYMGFPDGRYIGIYNLKAMKHHAFVNQPTQKLPSDAAFVLRSVDSTQTPPLDTWDYLDLDFRLIAHETFFASDFNTLKRPWYVGAESSGQLFWTGFYVFSPSLEKGISIANPMYDAEGRLMCVLAADLTFNQLSEFLLRQKIGRTGKVLILDHLGQVIAPDISQVKATGSQISSTLVSDVYSRFLQHPDEPSFVIKEEGIKYLIYAAKLPVLFDANWMMLQIVPFDDFFGRMLQTQHEVLGMILIILVLSACVVIYFAGRISSPIVVLAEEVNKIRKLNLNSDVRVVSNVKEIALIDTAIDAMRRVVRSFARYVPKEIVRDLFQKQDEIALGGEKMPVTIFFSDVAGFTSIAESHSMDVLTPLLEEYFDAMTKIILSTHGTIDKFLGDGIMAFWGAPIPFADHAARACNSALLCNAMLSKLNQKRREKGLPEFQTRFGINTGVVIVGNIGTEDRMNYTVIGDAVNITSRLQEVDKVYHTSIIISESTYQELGEEFIARPLDYVAVKGKKEKTKIYELIGKNGKEPETQVTEAQIALCKDFTKAYEALERQELEQARALFAAIAKTFPDDYPTRMYLEKLN